MFRMLFELFLLLFDFEVDVFIDSLHMGDNVLVFLLEIVHRYKIFIQSQNIKNCTINLMEK